MGNTVRACSQGDNNHIGRSALQTGTKLETDECVTIAGSLSREAVLWEGTDLEVVTVTVAETDTTQAAAMP